jgi:hypothetical protein
MGARKWNRRDSNGLIWLRLWTTAYLLENVLGSLKTRGIKKNDSVPLNESSYKLVYKLNVAISWGVVRM